MKTAKAKTMISALVLSPSLRASAPEPRASEAVARSLHALVRVAVEGVLRDVAIVGPDDGLAELADAAGCAFIETGSTRDGLARGVAQMRADFVLVLEGGYAPPGRFAEEAGEFLLDPDRFRGALLRRAPHSVATRFAPGLARPVGALAPREKIAAAGPRDLAELIRLLKIPRSLSVRAQRVV
jgi:hypothetical protein